MSTNPNTVKSQDDLPTTNDGKRSSDVLVATLEKCERLQKQLDIALKCLDAVMQDEYTMETIDGGLSMYLYTGLEKIKELDTTNISDNITKAIKEIEDVSEWIKRTGRKF